MKYYVIKLYIINCLTRLLPEFVSALLEAIHDVTCLKFSHILSQYGLDFFGYGMVYLYHIIYHFIYK